MSRFALMFFQGQKIFKFIAANLAHLSQKGILVFLISPGLLVLHFLHGLLLVGLGVLKSRLRFLHNFGVLKGFYAAIERVRSMLD